MSFNKKLDPSVSYSNDIIEAGMKRKKALISIFAGMLAFELYSDLLNNSLNW
ncbi:hypothetical protein [Wolbachia endosymbiont (group B) of Villa cingulata]|uniref:hypothetical protein n=1 Tax=Wolbachia endosymbiont (group B) of Villa cingulata TaxID=3066157 RepID=UPI0033414409